MYCRNGISAANNACRAASSCGGDSLRDAKSSLCECRHLKHAHRAIPNNCSSARKFRAKFRYSFGADIQSHPTVGSFCNVHSLRCGVCLEFRRDHVIAGQHEVEFTLCRVGHRLVFDFRFGVATMLAIMRRLLPDDRGTTAIEYTLIVALISVAGISTFSTLGSKVLNMLGSVIP